MKGHNSEDHHQQQQQQQQHLRGKKTDLPLWMDLTVLCIPAAFLQHEGSCAETTPAAAITQATAAWSAAAPHTTSWYGHH
jgi:hypothetical protein